MTFKEWLDAGYDPATAEVKLSIEQKFLMNMAYDAAKLACQQEIEELKKENIFLRVALAERDLLFDETVEAYQRIVANLQDRGSK